MRICYVTPEFCDSRGMVLSGGLSSYLDKISRILVERGHQVVLVVVIKEGEGELSIDGRRVVFVNSTFRKTFLQKVMWPLIPSSCRKRVKRNFGIRAASRAIRTIHSATPIDLIQYASYRGMGREPEKDIPSCVRISSYAKLWQKYYGYKDLSEIEGEVRQFVVSRFMYGPSKYVAAYIKNDLGLSQDITIIETPYFAKYGKEDASLADQISAWCDGDEYILFYGTIGALKGVLEIAGAVYRILEKHRKLRLVLVGKELLANGKSTIEAVLSAAKEHAGRVKRFESQPHSLLIPAIRRAKAVLLPSRIDNLPNTCIEALGLSKIVIGSCGASFEQLLDDGVSGILCEAGNADSIVNAVDRLMAMDGAATAAMERAAYCRSLTLSPDVIVPQVLKYYEYVIANWKGPDCR